jgi:hypothetical protein
MITSQHENNHLLYSLPFFLHFTEHDLRNIDVDTRITHFNENNHVLAVSFMEMNMEKLKVSLEQLSR